MKEESLLLLSDLQKLINQVVLIDYTIIILGDGIMSATGLFIFLIAIIGIAVLGALIAVIAAVSGASAAISDEEDGLEENA